MKEKTPTYRNFLDNLSVVDESQLKENAAEIIRLFRPSSEPVSRFEPAAFLVDYSTKKYLFVDDSWFKDFGFSAELFRKGGLEGYISHWHPNDFRVMNTIVFPELLQFIRQKEKDDYLNYVFSYNYRVINARHEVRTVLQRFSYIPGPVPDGPSGAVGVAFDITHYKNDTSIICTIEKQEQTAMGMSYQLLDKKVHPVYELTDLALLSKKEVEVLKLLADGMSSKQIAGMLSLSIFTVNNHRKSLLMKTGCRTSSEVISFAAKRGLI